jgi:hypothetical protein
MQTLLKFLVAASSTMCAILPGGHLGRDRAS